MEGGGGGELKKKGVKAVKKIGEKKNVNRGVNYVNEGKNTVNRGRNDVNGGQCICEQRGNITNRD